MYYPHDFHLNKVMRNVKQFTFLTTTNFQCLHQNCINFQISPNEGAIIFFVFMSICNTRQTKTFGALDASKLHELKVKEKNLLDFSINNIVLAHITKYYTFIKWIYAFFAPHNIFVSVAQWPPNFSFVFICVPVCRIISITLFDVAFVSSFSLPFLRKAQTQYVLQITLYLQIKSYFERHYWSNVKKAQVIYTI